MLWKTFNSRTTAFEQFGNTLEFLVTDQSSLVPYCLRCYFLAKTLKLPLAVFFTFIPSETLESSYTEGKKQRG